MAILNEQDTEKIRQLRQEIAAKLSELSSFHKIVSMNDSHPDICINCGHISFVLDITDKSGPHVIPK